MIKAIKIIILALLLSQVTFSQISEKAIGINLIAGTIMGMEVCYQDKITDRGLADIKLGYGKMNTTVNLRASANYDFIIPYEADLNFYIGPGITAGYYYGINNAEFETSYSGAILNLTANIGAEYYFQIPLKVAFVIKPEASLIRKSEQLTGQLLFSYCFH
ncbi:MAG: hypothetical protein H7X71_03060 [Chitinophagales bacterium]|nr:hypothetical protein [Chitinophagales bacterium]